KVENEQNVDVGRLVAATLWTVAVAIAAAVAATAVALPIAALAARFRGAIPRAIESLGYLSHALPGIVVGLSLVFLTLRLLPGLYQSIIVLVFGYTVLFASKSIGTARASVEGVSPTLLMVARTLGETPFGAWRRVTVPLVLPGIGVGALLVMIATMKELPATLILRPTGVNTLATELWTRTLVVEFGQAAPYAALLVLIAAIPAMLLSGARSEKGDPE
ncbi:MAG: iron ABC transporter permease, partial [Pontimonas sp.]